jgi:uncharacterized MAPEG superfamily protein
MTVSAILLTAIVAAAVAIYFPYAIVAYGRFQVGFDPAAPRALFDKLPPYAQRATWAHQNCFEAFTVFAPAALMAYLTQPASSLVSTSAIAFVVSRYLFSVFYLLNWPVPRSLMFGIGAACSGTLFVLSLQTVWSAH